MENFILIEAPSNLGLKAPSPDSEPGVKFFPEAMEREGFAQLAGIREKITVSPPAYSMIIDEESKVRNADKIIDYSKELASAIDKHIQKKNIVVVLGGDCSVLIAAALSLKRNGNYGLFFLDGHTDYVLPHQSGSGGAAGMDLAIVTGNGHNKLTNIENLKPYVHEENVFCVANRDVSIDWYVRAIRESNIHYYDLLSLRVKGISTIVKEFLNMVSLKKLDGFWIHFDVDVLNNDIMPCVDSPQPDGLSYEELKLVLNPLIHSNKFAGIDITIFDPTLDVKGIYAKQFATEMASILKQDLHKY
ncbi:MAG TPA: arginase family protein [Chitinophagaceae bacterium]|jgi:arginase|nr:arginase family protein [Chitinophagaceae bacterium]